MYVPVMKNRTVEIAVIKKALENGLSSNIIPLIEVVQEKSRVNLKLKSFSEEIKILFKDTNNKFFVDIINRPVSNNVNPTVQEFVTNNNRDSTFTIKSLLSCSEINNCIPVLSYDDIELLEEEKVLNDIEKLRAKFDNIAIRLSPTQYNVLSNVLFEILKENDYFLFDIQKNKHTSPSLSKSFKKIKNEKTGKKINTILLVDNKPTDHVNVGIIDGKLIDEIDVSYLEDYKKDIYSNFDGVADYVGVTSVLPTKGGAISPAGIYYSRKDNKFVGYRYRDDKRVMSEFKDHIRPEIMNSEFWKQYSEEHHTNCEGCKTISDATGKTQGAWKGVTMSHYIYTLDEYDI